MNVINYINGVPIIATGSNFTPADVWGPELTPSGVQVVKQDPFLSNEVILDVPVTE